jgi:single-strand DNA-binding protein
MVNKVTLIGNLGQDPEILQIQGNNGPTQVARLRIATDEGYRDNNGNWVDRTGWHDVVAWRKVAERAQRSLKKGMLVYIEGKLQTRSWKDKDTGKDRYKTEVVANYFRIVNSRNIKVEEANPQPKPQPKPQPQQQLQAQVPETVGNAGKPDDDIPF